MTRERDTPAPQVSGTDESPGPDESIASIPLSSEARPLPAPDRPRTIPVLRLGPEDALAPEAVSAPHDEADTQPDTKQDAVIFEDAQSVQKPESGADSDQFSAETTSERLTPDVTHQPPSEKRASTDSEGAGATVQEALAATKTFAEPDDTEDMRDISAAENDGIAGHQGSAPLPKVTEDPPDTLQENAPPSREVGISEKAHDAVDPSLMPDKDDHDADLPVLAKAIPAPTETGNGPPPPATRPDPWAVVPDAVMNESLTAPETPDVPPAEPRAPSRFGQLPGVSSVARERPPCEAALFGKLLSRGDFIARRMPRLLQRPFEDWLIPLVQQTRTDLGGQWNSVWRGAGPWRFWIGPDVLGGSWQRDLRKAAHEIGPSGGAVTGVLLPSADRHGRDFPLVLVLADKLARLMPPPVTTSPDRAWYDLCDDLLYAARAEADISSVERALDRLPGPFLPDDAEAMDALLVQRALWAQGTETRPDGTSQIWHDIAQADHHLAASQRSYWWQAPKAGAAQRVLSLAGLPDAATFAFMLAQGHPGLSGPAP